MTKEQVVKKYENLVYSIAIKMKRKYMFDDLLQEGFIALLNADRCYKSKRGKGHKATSFMTYARHAIINAMVSHIARCGSTINLPVNAKILKSQKRKDMAVNAKNIVQMPEYNYSLCVGDCANISIESKSDLNYLLTFVNKLPQKLRLVIKTAFGLDGINRSARKDIAKELNISSSRVNQLINKGLTKLRRMLKEKHVKNNTFR